MNQHAIAYLAIYSFKWNKLDENEFRKITSFQYLLSWILDKGDTILQTYVAMCNIQSRMSLLFLSQLIVEYSRTRDFGPLDQILQ